VIDSDDAVSRLWGQLAAGTRRRGRPRPVNDLWIAACCLSHRRPLVTRNRRDFAGFADSVGLTLLE
jgi:predicted nucleic acid-binding protein